MLFEWRRRSINSSIFIGKPFSILSVGVHSDFNYFIHNKVFNSWHLIYSKNSEISQDDALTYGTAILVITIFSGICLLHYFYFGFYYGTRVRVAVCSLIYRKVNALILYKVHELIPILLIRKNCISLTVVAPIIAKSLEWYGAGKISQFIIEWCESLRNCIGCNASVMDITAHDRHRNVHFVEGNEMGGNVWPVNCLLDCSAPK